MLRGMLHAACAAASDMRSWLLHLVARGPTGALLLRARVDQRAIKVMTKIRNSPAATPMMTCWTGRGP